MNTAKTLWYRQPAADWNEALPLGNGRLGAMQFGMLEEERFQLSALPKEWPDGQLKGVHIRGNARVDLTWTAGRLERCVLHPVQEMTLEVRYEDATRRMKLKNSKTVILDSNLAVLSES